MIRSMTLDMTFEAREKIIRRDEFAAGKADTIKKIIVNNFNKGRSVEEIADITGESVDLVSGIIAEITK